MIKSAQMGKEIVITVINKIGVMADMTKIIADHGINIEAVAGYATEEGEAKITVVTDDNLRAKEALVKAGYKGAKENPVVVIELENKTGALKNVTAKLAAHNIDIKYVYGTTCSSACPAKLILSTSDNEKTLVAFNK